MKRILKNRKTTYEIKDADNKLANCLKRVLKIHEVCQLVKTYLVNSENVNASYMEWLMKELQGYSWRIDQLAQIHRYIGGHMLIFSNISLQMEKCRKTFNHFLGYNHTKHEKPLKFERVDKRIINIIDRGIIFEKCSCITYYYEIINEI